MKKLLICFVLIILILSLSLVSCNKGTDYFEYDKDAAFEIDIKDLDNALIFKPISSKEIKYGYIFFVGTVIAPSEYMYLGTALAQKGFLVAMPKMTGSFAYMFYESDDPSIDDEILYTKNLTDDLLNEYKNTHFFIGGHSQGGGAAVRYSQENSNKIMGTILYSPLCYSEDSISETSLNTLLLTADNDHVLTDDMKKDINWRLPDNTKSIVLENAAHMSFSTYDSDDTLKMFNNDGDGITHNQKQIQKNNTITETLNFMFSVIK